MQFVAPGASSNVGTASVHYDGSGCGYARPQDRAETWQMATILRTLGFPLFDIDCREMACAHGPVAEKWRARTVLSADITTVNSVAFRDDIALRQAYVRRYGSNTILARRS